MIHLLGYRSISCFCHFRLCFCDLFHSFVPFFHVKYVFRSSEQCVILQDVWSSRHTYSLQLFCILKVHIAQLYQIVFFTGALIHDTHALWLPVHVGGYVSGQYCSFQTHHYMKLCFTSVSVTKRDNCTEWQDVVHTDSTKVTEILKSAHTLQYL